MEKELSDCQGCVGIIKRDSVDLSDPVTLMYFHEGEWDSVCSFAHVRTKVLKECPCWGCLIRPICHIICEPLHEIIEKHGSFNRELRFK
jgi:hypothetical protein